MDAGLILMIRNRAKTRKVSRSFNGSGAAREAHRSIDTLCSILADPIRRDILRRLRHGGMSVKALAAPYPVSPPAVSRHLKMLEKAGLVVRSRLGSLHIISLPAPDDARQPVERLRSSRPIRAPGRRAAPTGR